jgi:hypothetical protein
MIGTPIPTVIPIMHSVAHADSSSLDESSSSSSFSLAPGKALASQVPLFNKTVGSAHVKQPDPVLQVAHFALQGSQSPLDIRANPSFGQLDPSLH